MEPVELYLERRHGFKKKPPDPVTGKKRIGCDVCGEGKRRRQHLGVPPSLNEGGSGMDRKEYWQIKMAWRDALRELIDASPLGALEEPLQGVYVEVQMGFPTYADRDEGNLRWMLEKTLGDVLVDARVIPADTFFPVRRYTMGNLDGVHSPGRSWLRLLIFECAVVRVPRGCAKTPPETSQLPLVIDEA